VTCTKHKPTPSAAKSKNMEHTCKHYGVHFVDYESMLHHVDVNHPLNTSQSCGELQHTSDESTRTHDAALVDNNKKELQSDKKRFHFRKSALDNTMNETSIIPQANEKYDLLQFLVNAKDDVETELSLQRTKQRSIK
jgi:hypothetical protein